MALSIACVVIGHRGFADFAPLKTDALVAASLVGTTSAGTHPAITHGLMQDLLAHAISLMENNRLDILRSKDIEFKTQGEKASGKVGARGAPCALYGYDFVVLPATDHQQTYASAINKVMQTKTCRKLLQCMQDNVDTVPILVLCSGFSCFSRGVTQ